MFLFKIGNSRFVENIFPEKEFMIYKNPITIVDRATREKVFSLQGVRSTLFYPLC